MWRLVRTILGTVVVLFLILMAVAITYNSLRYFYPYTIPSRFLDSKRDWFPVYLPALYGHIISSGLILVVGALQCSATIRRRFLGLHRALGQVYTWGILGMSAPCGLVMSFFAIDRGIWSMLNFLTLSLLWAWFTWRGYRSIAQGDLSGHRRWMFRSYALTLSAVLLRLYTGLFVYFFQWWSEAAYVAAAWLSWLPQLVMVEIVERWRRR